MRYYGKIHSKLPIFCVKSVKIYTAQKNLHWRRQPRQWQLSGMSDPLLYNHSAIEKVFRIIKISKEFYFWSFRQESPQDHTKGSGDWETGWWRETVAARWQSWGTRKKQIHKSRYCTWSKNMLMNISTFYYLTNTCWVG